MIMLALVAVLLYIWSENSHVEVCAPYHQEKLEASRLMLKAMETIKAHRADKGIFIDELGEPLASVLIGQKYSIITTTEGLLSSKLTTLNPNFAAVMVDMLYQARIKPGDKVAAAMTGSFPGLNIAFYAACEVLLLEPVVITSIGSSSFGANEPDFTWLDMEILLRQEGIFSGKSIAASLGGGADDGVGLSQLGRQTLRDAVARSGLPLIEKPSLEESIDHRMELYGDIAQYKAFINIGGGIASLGHPANGDLIKPGFSIRLEPKNYPGFGVINYFGDEIPVIHLQNIEDLRRLYGMPLAPTPLPPVGFGAIFTDERYDIRVTVISLVVIALLLAAVFRLDKKLFKLRDEGVEPDSLL